MKIRVVLAILFAALCIFSSASRSSASKDVEAKVRGLIQHMKTVRNGPSVASTQTTSITTTQTIDPKRTDSNGLTALTSPRMEEIERQRAKRDGTEWCDICSDCDVASCKDLGAQICAADGATTGLVTEAVIRIRVTYNYINATNEYARDGILADVLQCFVGACGSISATEVPIYFPSLDESPECRDSDIHIDDDRVIAVYRNTTNSDLYHSVCFFNKLTSELSAYDSGLLGALSGTASPDLISACYPLVITELYLADTANQAIEIWNGSPDVQLDLSDFVFTDSAEGFDVPLTGVTVDPHNFVVIQKGTVDIMGNPTVVTTTDTFGTDNDVFLIQHSPSSTIVDVVDTTQSSFALLGTLGPGEGFALSTDYDSSGEPTYLTVDNNEGGNWHVCFTFSYATSTCSLGTYNPTVRVSMGKRQAAELPSVLCTRPSHDFCTGATFGESRSRLVSLFGKDSSINAKSFQSANYSANYFTDLLAAIAKPDLMILGEAELQALSLKDYESIRSLVAEHGVSLLAHVSATAAPALASALLGAIQEFYVPEGGCGKQLNYFTGSVAQQGFVHQSEKKIADYTTKCHTGMTCTKGISLVVDTDIPSDAQTSLCYAEVGMGRVLLATSFDAFTSQGIVQGDNAQLLHKFVESAFFF